MKDTSWLSVGQTWSKPISVVPESSSHWDSACNGTQSTATSQTVINQHINSTLQVIICSNKLKTRN